MRKIIILGILIVFCFAITFYIIKNNSQIESLIDDAVLSLEHKDYDQQIAYYLAEAQKINPNYSEIDLYESYKDEYIQAMKAQDAGVKDVQLSQDDSLEDVTAMMSTLFLRILNKDNRLQLIGAVMNADIDKVTELLKDPLVDINQRDINGYTPLHWSASTHDDDAITQLLINAHVDVNIQDKNGNSPLILATTNQVDEIVKLLIDVKANLNLCDEDGNSALHIAAANNLSGIAQQLVQAHADMTIKNKNGQTALSVAKNAHAEEVARILIAAGATE